MKNRSQRGAARVSAVWMIVAFVLVFVAMAFGYIANTDQATAETARDKAVAAETEALAKYEAEISKTREVSDVLGFKPQDPETGEAIIGSTTLVEQAAQALEDFKGEFPDMDSTVKTFQDILPIVKRAHATKLTQIADLQAQIQQLEGQVRAAQSQTQQVTSSKDDEIAQLRSDLQDARDSAQQTQESLQSRLDSATDDRNQKDSELRTVRGELDQVSRDLANDKRATQTKLAQLKSKLAFTEEEFATAPDGEILAVSDQLPLGYINRGTSDKVLRGMSFQVRSGKPGLEHIIKGTATVRKVESDRAEVEFSNIADASDPITTGDKISNPLYDPEGIRNAVLVGRFTGTYSEADIRRLAQDIGINIQPEVTGDTDFLIVGGEIYLDEDGETLEEPIQPKDMPQYREGEAQGAVIVSYRTIAQFFKR